MAADTSIAALLERGLAQQRQGQHRAALASFEAALARQPGDAALHCRIGECCEALGDPGRADEAYVAAIAAEPDRPEAYVKAGDLARRMSAQAARAGLAEVAGQLRQGAYKYFCALGFRAVQRGIWAGAELAFRDALGVMPEDWAAAVERGRALYELGRLEESESVLRTGAARAPQVGLAQFHLAELLRRRGNTAAAEPLFRRAIELSPRLAAAHFGLSRLLRATGREGEAETSFQAAVELDPAFRTMEKE